MTIVRRANQRVTESLGRLGAAGTALSVGESMQSDAAVAIDVPADPDAWPALPGPASSAMYCPTAQPEMDGAVAFGVIGGAADEPPVAYLSALQPADTELLCLSGPRRATEVFRFGAPCVEGGCQHFGNGACRLGEQLSSDLQRAVRRLPPCGLRPMCRWWHEQGAEACLRCPGMVATYYEPRSGRVGSEVIEERVSGAARPDQ